MTMWVVHAGDDVYVRSAGGPNRPWYLRAMASGAGRIRVAGIERVVTFAAAGRATHTAIDAAYHAKYDSTAPSSLAMSPVSMPVLSPSDSCRSNEQLEGGTGALPGQSRPESTLKAHRLEGEAGLKPRSKTGRGVAFCEKSSSIVALTPEPRRSGPPRPPAPKRALGLYDLEGLVRILGVDGSLLRQAEDGSDPRFTSAWPRPKVVYDVPRHTCLRCTATSHAEEVGFEPTDPCRSHDFQPIEPVRRSLRSSILAGQLGCLVRVRPGADR